MDKKTQTSETIDLLIYLGAFWKRRYAILAIFFAVVLSAFVKTMFLSTHIFQATATIMPVKSERGLGSLGTNVRSLAGLAGISPGENDIDRFVNILKSRTIGEQVIGKLNLMDFFYGSQKARPDRKELQRYILIRRLQDEILNVVDNKKGLLEIRIETKNRNMSAQIANTYVDLLEKYIADNTLTTAKEHRNFVEIQFNRAKTDLAKSEEDLRKFKEEHGLISISDEMMEMVKSLGQLKDQMLAKEFELEVLKRLGAAKGNVQFEKLRLETEELRKQISHFGSAQNPSSGLFSVSPDKFPQLEMQMFKLMRDKAVQETLYELLAQYYQSAKLEEAKEEPKFQRLDVAVPPMKKVKPQRKIDMLAGGLIGIVVAIGYVVVVEYIDRTKKSRRDNLG